MSESVDIESGYGSQTTEIYIKCALSEDVESIRVRLAAARERMGYDLIEEEPALRGRGSRGWEPMNPRISGWQTQHRCPMKLSEPVGGLAAARLAP